MKLQVIDAAEELVKNVMSAYDSSHDWYHVNRVRRLALRLAESQPDHTLNSCKSSSPDMLVVELAALFHDLFDAKYASVNSGHKLDVSSWLRANDISESQNSLITKIIANVSYSKEMVLRQTGEWSLWHGTCVELHCVMDADKLDALGAFGIFRCAAFSGSRNIPLYLEKEDPMYVKSAVGHFEDKLFRLESMMMTEEGRTVAKRRTAIMRDIVERMNEEALLLDFETELDEPEPQGNRVN